jgi:glyoxylase-like metal-dependent hydrolase (beta-lactamase superfamily II)
MGINLQKLSYAIAQVRPGLWQVVFHLPSPTNCWLWQDADGLTLVDAGHPWNTSDILDAVGIIHQPLQRIVITHAHPDHAGAAAALSRKTGATVYAHQLDIPYLTGQASMADLDGPWHCRAILGAGRRLRILNPPAIENVQPVQEGAYVGDLRVLHTPGHTPGSISLWSEGGRAIFCGDNVCASRGLLHLGLPWFTLDRTTQRCSVRKYAELPAQLLLSGHGPVYCGDVPAAMQRLLR